MALVASGTMLLSGLSALAQVSGTNAVNVLEDNVNNAANVGWTAFIMIAGALLAVAIFMKFVKRR